MYNSPLSVKPSQNRDFQIRFIVLLVIVILIFFILILKIGYIQIVKNLSNTIRASKIREKVIRIPPIRGNIYSSDDQVLANNITAFNIVITPKELFKDDVLRKIELGFLSDVLKIDYTDIEKSIAENAKKNDFILAENITLDVFIKIKENFDNLPGVSYDEIFYRNYPNKDILSHALGYIGPINIDELKLYEKEKYKHSDYIGKSGLEQYYEKELRGEAGKRIFVIDAKMTIQEELKDKLLNPKPGNELVLSINLKLQKIVEDVLADRIGTIIVMKPANGEILAMASYPDFDPNIYILSTPENIKKKREIILNTKETPLINRGIQAVYPPGSVFKVIPSSAIINENLLSAYQRYYCTGIYRVGDTLKKCWVYPSGHGSEDLFEGIKDSCDVYFYNAARIIGPKNLKDYALHYGLGSYLNIDLPSEKSGIIPSPELAKTQGKEWYDGDTMNMIIGQGEVKTTPLQILNLMSIVCNKGYAYRPHILKEIRSSHNGATIKKTEPEKFINLTDKINESTFIYLHSALRAVTSGDGTAGGAFYSNPFKIAGKTGTAEVGISGKKQTHSWFAGFGPVDYALNEQIAVVVLIEYENNDYLRYAAPLASMIFNSYYNNEDYIKSANRIYYPVKKSYRKEGQY